MGTSSYSYVRYVCFNKLEIPKEFEDYFSCIETMEVASCSFRLHIEKGGLTVNGVNYTVIYHDCSRDACWEGGPEAELTLYFRKPISHCIAYPTVLVTNLKETN